MQKLLYASALTSLMTITACADKQPTRPLLQLSTPVENGTPSPGENGTGAGGRALFGGSLLTA